MKYQRKKKARGDQKQGETQERANKIIKKSKRNIIRWKPNKHKQAGKKHSGRVTCTVNKHNHNTNNRNAMANNRLNWNKHKTGREKKIMQY